MMTCARFLVIIGVLAVACQKRAFHQDAAVLSRSAPYPHPAEKSCAAGEIPGSFFLHPASPRPTLPAAVFTADDGALEPRDPDSKEWYLQLNLCVAEDSSNARLVRAFVWGAGFENLEIPGKSFEILKGDLADVAFGGTGDFLARAKASQEYPDNEYTFYLASVPGGFAVTASYQDPEDGKIHAVEGRVAVGTLQPEPPSFGAENPCAHTTRISTRTLRVEDAIITLEYCRGRDSYGLVRVEVEDESRELPRSARGKRFVVEGRSVRQAVGHVPAAESRPFGSEPRLYFSSHHHFSCDALWISLPHASYAFTSASVRGGYGEECHPDVPNAPERGRGSSRDLFYTVAYPERTLDGSLRCDHFLDACD